jgi:hypothetical protein
MAKSKTHPWDPADHIVDGEDVLVYLKLVTPEEYDPVTTPYFLNCIARSRGVAEIASCEFHEPDGIRSITVTTTSGVSATLAIEPNIDADSIRAALTPAPAPASP